MSLEITQVTAPEAVPLPSGWLVAANEVLALSSAELQQVIHEEQMNNPALEVEERPVCPGCGRALHGPHCPHCQRSASPAESDPGDPPLIDEGTLWPAGASGGNADEWGDPLTWAGTQVDWKEQLPDQDAPLIEYLVGSLDEDGYLTCTLEDVTQLFAVPAQRVQAVLEVLQAQEPAGIGAHTLQECLLLQLQRLDVDDALGAIVAQIIAQHLTLLGQGNVCEMVHHLGLSRRRVEVAIAVIKERLTPFPLRGYLGPDLQTGAQLTSTLLPDVIISRRAPEEGGGYEVEIAEAQRLGLTINTAYLEAARAMRGERSESSQHVQEYLARTRLFITNIKRRWETLAAITHSVIELQPDFLVQGRSALRRLTRADVAERLGIHPSTVSRATADKYILLPNAEVVPFSRFFESNRSVKEALKEMVRQETRPLSDQRVTDLLNTRGIPVARRTIAKYREQLGLLPSTLR